MYCVKVLEEVRDMNEYEVLVQKYKRAKSLADKIAYKQFRGNRFRCSFIGSKNYNNNKYKKYKKIYLDD